MTGFASLEPFNTLTARAVPLDIANCDTDQLLPARFLRLAVTDPNYPNFLLHDLRFNHNGSSRGHIFDSEEFQGARIVVGDINFGCGSSREAAVDGLTANNFRAVIAPSFGDIFYNNCIQNGVLPIRLAEQTCQSVRAQLHEYPGSEITIDLAAQSVIDVTGESLMFDIDPLDKHRLLNGLDDISMTMQYQDEIVAFTSAYRQRHRWVG